MNRPTAKEKNAFRSGVPQFDLVVVDGVIFFLSRFGTLNWMDSPFNRHLYSDNRILQLEEPGPTQGYSLHVMLIDSVTGVLVHQRLIGLDHDLSMRLRDAIINQPVIPDYDQRVRNVMARYSTKDLVTLASSHPASSKAQSGTATSVTQLRPSQSPVFEPVLLPDLVGEKMPAPVWEPGYVPSPVFEPVPVPDLLGQKLPSPSWNPDVIPSLVFEPVRLPELVGELLKSPAWFPSVVPAPVFEKLLIPSLVGALLTSPAWAPSIIPAPTFESITLPEWALSPLPAPEWSVNPIPAPAIDSSILLSGLAAIGEAFASLETRVSEKLQVLQQKFSSFVTATQTSLSAWGENIKTNFSTVIEFIPKVTSSGLLPSAKTFGAFLTVTAGALATWGPNIAENVKSVLEFIPQAVHDGLTAAGTPFVDWVNKTSDGVAKWAGNLAVNAGKGISSFVQNFMSGLSAAWEGFVGFMKATGEKISNWWSANKSWAAPAAGIALAGAGVAAFVLSGGAAAVAAAIPKLAPLALPAMAFANGGVVRSPTLALMGEYPNARSNPEIIAPQDILRQTFREEQGRQDYSDVISAVNAGIGAIVEAINSQDYSTHLDGKTLMQSVERAQRQRGVDIMGGGVLG